MHKVVFFFKKMLFPVLLLQFLKTTVSIMAINSCTIKIFLILRKDFAVRSILFSFQIDTLTFKQGML